MTFLLENNSNIPVVDVVLDKLYKMFIVNLDFYSFHSRHNFRKQENKLFRRVGPNDISIRLRTKKSTVRVTKQEVKHGCCSKR